MLRVRQLTFGNADTRDVGGRKLNVLDQELGGIILVSSKNHKHLHNYYETMAHLYH